MVPAAKEVPRRDGARKGLSPEKRRGYHVNSFRAKLRALLKGIIWMQASICAVYTIVTGKGL